MIKSTDRDANLPETSKSAASVSILRSKKTHFDALDHDTLFIF